MYQLKLTRMGGATGAIFPEELLALLHSRDGDTVVATATPEGGISLERSGSAKEDQLAAGREFMREYDDTFHELAK